MRRGQLLATLEDTRYDAALAQAIGRMNDLKAVLAKLRAGSRPEEIAATGATMNAPLSTVRVDRIIYRRNARLIVTHAVSQQALDEAKAALSAWRRPAGCSANA